MSMSIYMLMSIFLLNILMSIYSIELTLGLGLIMYNILICTIINTISNILIYYS